MKKSTTSQILTKYLIPASLFLFISAIYIYSLCPSLYPGDNADTITAAATLGIPHPPGYPLFTVLGYLFSKIPLMEIPWRINLMSALFSSLTIVFIYLIILKITKKKFAALFGSLLLAFTYQYFSQSLYADFLSLSILLLCVQILILLYWYETKKTSYLYLFSFLAGINFSNHQASAFILPAVFYLVYIKDKKIFLSWDFAKCIGLFILGLFPYIYLPIRAHQNPAYIWGEPGTLSGFFNMILRKEYGGNDFSQIGYFYYRLWDFLFTLGWRQFYLVGFLIGIYGFIKLKKTDKTIAYFLLLLVIFTGFVFAFFANASSDKNSIVYLERFFIVGGSLFAILIGIGAAEIEKTTQLPGFLLLIIPLIFLYLNYSKVTKRNYYYAIDYARNIVKNLPPNAFVFAANDTVYDTPTFEIWYLQYVEGQRKDLTVIPGGDSAAYVLMKSMEKRTRDYNISIVEIAKKRPVFTTTLTELYWPTKMDNFIPKGLIYEYSNNREWINDYNTNEAKNYLSNYTLRGLYNNDQVKDYPTQAVIKAYANAWIDYGIVLYRQKKLKEAAESYLKALQFDPKNEIALTNYAGVLSDAGKYDQAIEVYNYILELNRKSQFAQKGLEVTLDRKLKAQNK